MIMTKRKKEYLKEKKKDQSSPCNMSNSSMFKIQNSTSQKWLQKGPKRKTVILVFL